MLIQQSNLQLIVGSNKFMEGCSDNRRGSRSTRRPRRVLGIEHVSSRSSREAPASSTGGAPSGWVETLIPSLLFSISWVIGLTAPLFTVLGQEISGRDIILIVGGLFLIAKSTHEIHGKLEGEEGHASARVAPSFAGVIVQILLLDAVFSLDSVITAVGMVDNVWIMVAAVVVSIAFMMAFAGRIGAFVQKHPTVKMLALSFLILIGVTLLGEGFDQHIPKGYIYFAMAFSVFVEMLNLKLRKPAKAPVKLHDAYVPEEGRAS